MSDTKLHEHTCRDLQTYQLNTRKKMNIKSNSRLEKPTTSKVHSDDETKGFFFLFLFFFFLSRHISHRRWLVEEEVKPERSLHALLLVPQY